MYNFSKNKKVIKILRILLVKLLHNLKQQEECS